MLRPSWNSPCALFADLLFDLVTRTASMNVLRLRRLRNDAIKLIGTDQFTFPSIPFGKNLGRRRTTEDTRMDEAWEADPGDVARGTEDAFEIPNRFRATLQSKLLARPRFRHISNNDAQQRTPITLVLRAHSNLDETKVGGELQSIVNATMSEIGDYN